MQKDREQLEISIYDDLRAGDLIIATSPGKLIIERDREPRPFWDVGDPWDDLTDEQIDRSEAALAAEREAYEGKD